MACSKDLSGAALASRSTPARRMGPTASARGDEPLALRYPNPQPYTRNPKPYTLTLNPERWEAESTGGAPRLDAITSIATSLGALEVSPTAITRSKANAGGVRSKVVSDAAAVGACDRLLRELRVLVEPACGAALAALVGPDGVPKDEVAGMESVVVIVCGGSGITPEILADFQAKL
mmetsp:Transcript_41587/g.130252  ORF Transcript_41587/g.130252 Transcript_41587/m.130252 type:complete len:177 (-) Transcript_41587:1962-2492(-)